LGAKYKGRAPEIPALKDSEAGSCGLSQPRGDVHIRKNPVIGINIGFAVGSDGNWQMFLTPAKSLQCYLIDKLPTTGSDFDSIEKSRSPEFGQSCTKAGRSSHSLCSRVPA